jgi:hypothetical protein
MVVPTHKRDDRTVPVITVILDNLNTSKIKKFKCSVCGGTVFAYYDTLHILLPVDITDNPTEDRFYNSQNALTEVECTHLIKNTEGLRVRCRTRYLLSRG